MFNLHSVPYNCWTFPISNLLTLKIAMSIELLQPLRYAKLPDWIFITNKKILSVLNQFLMRGRMSITGTEFYLKTNFCSFDFTVDFLVKSFSEIKYWYTLEALHWSECRLTRVSYKQIIEQCIRSINFVATIVYSI